MAKQTIYNAGIYVRLSQEDMRAGESLSIDLSSPNMLKNKVEFR